MLNWKRTTSGLNDSVYASDCGNYEVRKAVTAWGTDWRLLHRDDEALCGWEWCQSYRLLRDAKAGAQALADNTYDHPDVLADQARWMDNAYSNK